MGRWNRTFAILVAFVAPAAFALGEKPFIADTQVPGAALIADGETLATLVTDSGEDRGVVRAAADTRRIATTRSINWTYAPSGPRRGSLEGCPPHCKQ